MMMAIKWPTRIDSFLQRFSCQTNGNTSAITRFHFDFHNPLRSKDGCTGANSVSDTAYTCTMAFAVGKYDGVTDLILSGNCYRCITTQEIAHSLNRHDDAR